MTITIKPPVYNNKKNYERYKQELLAWKEITDLDARKQAIAVALSLPEEDDTQIRDKVFDQLPLEDLKKENGFSVLVTFLDEHLGKDDLSDSIEKFYDFENYERVDGQTINNFIANYDIKYRQIEKKNMKLPSEILAFKLIQKSKINHMEKLLVLTGLNYENKARLYEEAKLSLKKFVGENISTEKQSKSLESSKVEKSEDVQALVSTCNLREKNKQVQKTTGVLYNKGGVRRICGGSHRKSDTNVTLIRRRNPLGINGRPIRCYSCGSFRHLLVDCPDSWENMKKVKYCKKEVWPMGYLEETKRGNTNNSALYDTGGYKSMNENCGKRRNKACADVYTGSKYAIGFSSNKVSHDNSAKPVESELNLTFQVKYGRGAFNSKIKSTSKLDYRGAKRVETGVGSRIQRAENPRWCGQARNLGYSMDMYGDCWKLPNGCSSQGCFEDALNVRK